MLGAAKSKNLARELILRSLLAVGMLHMGTLLGLIGYDMRHGGNWAARERDILDPGLIALPLFTAFLAPALAILALGVMTCGALFVVGRWRIWTSVFVMLAWAAITFWAANMWYTWK